MRTLIALTVAAGLLATAAAADSANNCAAAWWSNSGVVYTGVMTYADFMEMCLADNFVATAAWSPSAPTAHAIGRPADATGRCKDGTWTMAATYQDACITHGGVASWLPER